jgi:nitroimidazol reductase NimA-like FMN-containing flavoprotein (pyridoxamine 5'-phosphate oxidase superfamily)
MKQNTVGEKYKTNDNEKQMFERIIDDNLYLSLATVDSNGNPWISNVFFAYGEGKLYWYSRKDADHSINIKHNSNVAISIYNSTKTGDDVEALYIKGVAHEISQNNELISGLKLYAGKSFNTLSERRKFILSKRDFLFDSRLRMYCVEIIEVHILAPSEILNGKYLDFRKDITNSIVI